MLVVELVDMQECSVYLHEYLCCVTFPLGAMSCIVVSHESHGISDMHITHFHYYGFIGCQLHYLHFALLLCKRWLMNLNFCPLRVLAQSIVSWKCVDSILMWKGHPFMREASIQSRILESCKPVTFWTLLHESLDCRLIKVDLVWWSPSSKPWSIVLLGLWFTEAE